MLNTNVLDKLYHALLKRGAHPPEGGDLIYLLGQTRFNEASVLDKAAELNGRIGFIGHDGTEAVCGFPGFSHWRQELLARKVGDWRIIAIEGSYVEVGGKQIIHTLSELEAMARYASEHKLERVLLVAPHWHLIRGFMTAVLAGKRHHKTMQIVPVLGKALPWDEAGVHSQGKSGGIRADFTFSETLRLFAYYEQGNLSSAEEALEHLENNW